MAKLSEERWAWIGGEDGEDILVVVQPDGYPPERGEFLRGDYFPADDGTRRDVLIAAAPRLLAALKEARNLWHRERVVAMRYLGESEEAAQAQGDRSCAEWDALIREIEGE